MERREPGNQLKTQAVSKAGKSLGSGLFFFNLGYDGYGVYNYYNNPMRTM